MIDGVIHHRVLGREPVMENLATTLFLRRHGGLIISALASGSSCPGLSPGLGQFWPF